MSTLLQREEATIRQLVNDGHTAKEVANELQRIHAGERGLSIANLKRFCSAKVIYFRLLLNQRHERVAATVARLGPTYGRRLLNAVGKRIGEPQTAQSLTWLCCC